MVSDSETQRLSKFLSLVLRHQPETIGITLDENGWTDVAALLGKLKNRGFRIGLDELRHAVETNSKKRFALNADETRIRANQG
ncbi:MAG: RNA 2'-phosphotransferase, partial [Cytophagaceae bacterium]|nr:RNA 2'-phosphotransferase [Cytophagaceae bacterium]